MGPARSTATAVALLAMLAARQHGGRAGADLREQQDAADIGESGRPHAAQARAQALEAAAANERDQALQARAQEAAAAERIKAAEADIIAAARAHRASSIAQLARPAQPASPSGRARSCG